MAAEADKSKTYIYGDREYVLTGRDANKTRTSGREVKKVEIRPVEVSDPEDRTHNKWVNLKDLYVVEDEEEDNEDEE